MLLTNVGSLALSIPAVTGIVSHFVGQMLSEAKSLGVHAHFGHEEEDASHKVAQRFIGNQFLQTRKSKALSSSMAVFLSRIYKNTTNSNTL